MRTLLKQLLFAVIACGSTLSTAAPEFIPIQERASGQALAGGNQMNDSLYSNPAASAFVPVYSIEGTFLAPKTFAVSVLDTQTSYMGGALGYFRQKIEGYEQPYQGIKLGLMGKITQNLAVGVAGKALWGPNFDTGAQTSAKDLDIGTLANFGSVQVGFATRNLLGGAAAFDQQREMVLGGRLGYNNLFFVSAAATTRTKEITSPYQVGVGAEYVSPYFFGLRGGFRHRFDTKATYWSAGASMLAPKLLLHYAAQFPGLPSESIEHSVAAALLF